MLLVEGEGDRLQIGDAVSFNPVALLLKKLLLLLQQLQVVGQGTLNFIRISR
jgi:hypothetical protein